MINILLIFVGVVVGVIVCWLFGIWFSFIFIIFVFGMLIVNWVGCLLIGVVMGLMLYD